MEVRRVIDEDRRVAGARLRQLLGAAAHGEPPPADGDVEVMVAPPGPAQAVVAFTAHTVVAVDAAAGWLRARLHPGDPGAPTLPDFLAGLAAHLGARAGQLDVVLAAWRDGPVPPSPALVELRSRDHPRVARSMRYRHDVRVWGTEDGAGLVTLGRGLAGRWEIAFEVRPGARGAGLGRALALAGRGLAPPGEPLYAQVAPGNVASLRALLGAGYVPVASEVLFMQGPHPVSRSSLLRPGHSSRPIMFERARWTGPGTLGC